MITNRLLLVVMLTLTATGCQSFSGKSLSKLWPSEDASKKVVKSKFQQPSRMVVLWSPAMYNQPGSPATRGFGGRIYFYNGKDEVIPVEGQLVVYGYNDSNTTPGKTTPDKTFVFRADQFSKHFTPTQLGASYSVWVPWDAVGGPEADISLVPIFTSAEGQVCVGQQAQQNLPGTKTEQPKFEIHQGAVPVTQIAPQGSTGPAFQSATAYPSQGLGGDIAQASYQQPAATHQPHVNSPIHSTTGAGLYYQPTTPVQNAESPRVVETLSIALPSGTAQRLVGDREGAPTTQNMGGIPPQTPGVNMPALQQGPFAPNMPSTFEGTSASRGDNYRFTVARSARSTGPVVPRSRVVSSGSAARSEPRTPQAPASSNLPQAPGPLPMQLLPAGQP